MADENDELVLKLGVSVNDDELKKLKDEIKKLQQQTSSNAIKLGLSSSSNQSSGNVNNVLNNSAGSYSDEIAQTLSQSEKHLLEMLNILKDDHQRAQRTPEKQTKNENLEGPIPFVNNLMNSNVGSALGGGIGLVAGAIAGGNAIAGAQVGTAIGNFIQNVFGVAKEKIEAVAKLFDERVMEDVHFRQLSQQTGMAVDNIYNLGVQAKLSGTSLEQVVSSNQRLSDELMGGIDDKKAQYLMALNINPREALLESGGDIGKLNQTIFERASKATQGVPAYQRSSILSGLGFSTEEQTSRKYLYRSDTIARAQGIYNVATGNGRTPFETGEKLQETVLKWMGSEQEFLAAIRNTLTSHNLAGTLSTKLMNIKADIVQIIAKAIEGPEPYNPSVNKTKINTLNQNTNENVRIHDELINRLHPKSPASGSASAKVSGAQ